jgi:chaperone modulatory protein CbpM
MTEVTITEFYSETEVLAAVPRLTPLRLTSFVAARIILPLTKDDAPAFRRIDLARIELLCDLTEEFDLDDDALGLVISLVDQLHEARRDLRAICLAVAAEGPEVRNRIGGKLTEAP